MALTKAQVEDIYEKRSRRYDVTANLYYLLGFRELEYRKRAVETLDLTSGQTVVELCCGTGLNFRFIENRIGPAGRLIAVDLTEGMLRQAKRRVDRHGWKNVQLIHHDVGTFEFPRPIDRVLSTFALTLVPEYDRVIELARDALSPGGKFVLLDFKKPEHRSDLLLRMGVWATRPFAVTLDLAERHPWESVERYFEDCRIEQLYFGFAYIASGWARAPREGAA